jgi:hypothetical protein
MKKKFNFWAIYLYLPLKSTILQSTLKVILGEDKDED